MIYLHLMSKRFAGFLAELIKNSGMEKVNIAPKLGITASYLSILTSNRAKPPSLNLLRKLSKVLKLSEKEEAELLYLAIEERSPDVLGYLLSEKGTQILRDKGTEIYQSFMDPEIQKYLDIARKFFNSKGVPEERKKLIESTMASDLKLYEDEGK